MIDKPPYTITPDILSRVEEIGEMIGRAESAGISQDLHLRRINRIRTIHGSLAIEGNTSRWKALFACIPVESLVHARQADYYEAIRQSSADGESTAFIAFMLAIIVEALRMPTASDQEGDQVTDQVAKLLATLIEGPRTAAQLMADLGLSHRPTFRENYLRPAISAGLVEMTRPESPSGCGPGRRGQRCSLRGTTPCE